MKKIKIPGYKRLFREDGTNNRGGIKAAIKDSIKTISILIHRPSIVYSDKQLKSQYRDRSNICVTEKCNTSRRAQYRTTKNL